MSQQLVHVPLTIYLNILLNGNFESYRVCLIWVSSPIGCTRVVISFMTRTSIKMLSWNKQGMSNVGKERWERRGRREETAAVLLTVSHTIFHWYSFWFHLFQQRCLLKYWPWWWANLNISRMELVQLERSYVQFWGDSDSAAYNNLQQVK